VTLREARAKAKRLTAAGTPTMVAKNASRPGGYQTISVQAVKERAARARLGRVHGLDRLNRRGERFREADLLELRVEFKGNCFVCGKPLDGALSNGRKDEVVEHGHHDNFVRSLTHHRCNTLLSIVEDLGIDITVLAARIAGALAMPWVSMTPAEIKAAKRRAA